MSDESVQRGLDRRSLLKGGLAILGAGAASGAVLAPRAARAVFGPARGASPPTNPGGPKRVHLAATDGWVSMPGAGSSTRPPFWPDPLAPSPFDTYVFGFRDVTPLFDPGTGEIANQAALDALKGKAQISAPLMHFDQDDEIHVSLTNLGLQIRPDLTDGHTVHWHGFNNAIPLFDGVPELSIAVPIGRKFVYEYRPREAGTYMYHCHFEDVEHVQMGMTGVLYVRPKQNASPVGSDPAGTKYAYNDGDGSTRYDREFAFILTELWPESHYRDAHIQVTDWTDFNPAFWLMNGRGYPDTLAPASGWDTATFDLAVPAQARLQYQPQTGLIQANAGDRVLIRLANLGYQHHTMTLDGIPVKVVAKDAALLRGHDGTDLSYLTSSVAVGPGESRDLLFTAPVHSGGTGPDIYRFYDRAYAQLNNNGTPALGGMLTEVRVHPPGTLGGQPVDQPNT